MRSWIVVSIVAVAIAAAAPAAGADPLEVRFYPEATIHPHELEARRGISTLVLQNVAIVNRGDREVTLESAAIELVDASGAAVQIHRLSKADLAAAAARTARLAGGGLLQAYAFQFRPERLLADATAAESETLAPGQAVLLGHRVLVTQSPVTALRFAVAAKGATGDPARGEGVLTVGAGARNEYRFPLAGRWFVAVAATPHGHHRWVVAEEFALDIVRLGADGKSFAGDGRALEQYHAYGAEVLAVADGTVAAVEDGQPESLEALRRPDEDDEAYAQRVMAQQAALLARGTPGITGNYVAIAHANGEHSHYAHLQPGSVRVRPGDLVRAGQPIARLGQSGNSTEPHLHFQVTDGPEPLLSRGLPVRFTDVRLPWADWERAIQSGDMVETF